MSQGEQSGAARGRPPRVAVVDDEDDVATFYRLVLEDAGAEVLVASDAATAAAAVARFRPDVVCLDVLMPGALGLSVFRELRASPALAEVPVVVLSGLTERAELERLFERERGLLPPEEFLEKPVDADLLRSVVVRLLGGREGRP